VLAPAANAASLYLALDDGALASIAVPNASGQAGQWTWVPVTRWLAAGERQAASTATAAWASTACW
jgi:heparin/heparan-sulfate lyase